VDREEQLRFIANQQVAFDQQNRGRMLGQAQFGQGQSLANLAAGIGVGGLGLGSAGGLPGTLKNGTRNFLPEPPKKKTGREQLQDFVSEWIKDVNYD